MPNPLVRFEVAFELTAAQVAMLLDCPLPTYYQYRRTGKAPAVVFRFIEVLSTIPIKVQTNLMNKYIVSRKRIEDDEL